MTEHEVRINVQQPALRKYRVPFFREWSSRPGVQLKLFYGFKGSELPDGIETGFHAECVPMRSIGVGPLRFKWQPAQWRSAAKGACEVLVLSWNVQYFSLIPSLMRARKNGIKTILWGHGFSKRESVSRRMIRNSVGRLADALVFYDYATAESFVEAGWPRNRIHVAPNSLDQNSIQASRERWLTDSDKLAMFQKTEGLAGRTNLVYIGRIYEENRLEILIEALPAIRNQHPDVQVLFIGKINETARKLQQRAEVLGVTESVRWLGAIYDEDGIAPYMLSSTLFCYPSNIGLSIMHGMGYGLPVITDDRLAGHNPEIHVLQNGVNGCFYRHLDPVDLADVILNLLNSHGRLALMGPRARGDVLEGYTIEKMVDGFMGAVNAVHGK